MLWTGSLCFLAIQVMASERPTPFNCARPPSEITAPEKCCNIPPLFQRGDFEDCGIEKPSEKNNHQPPKLEDCSKTICILKIYNLMKDDSQVDMPAMGEFMDKWAEANSNIKDAVARTKERCLKENLPGPLNICGPFKMIYCITSSMFVECPKWEDSENCKKIRDHLEACKSKSS